MTQRIYVEDHTHADFRLLQVGLMMNNHEELMRAMLDGEVQIRPGESILEAIARIRADQGRNGASAKAA